MGGLRRRRRARPAALTFDSSAASFARVSVGEESAGAILVLDSRCQLTGGVGE